MVDQKAIVLVDYDQLRACFMPAAETIYRKNLIQLTNQFDMFFL